MVAFHALDMREVVASYLAAPVYPASLQEPDWSVVGTATKDVGLLPNLLLVVFAYGLQFSVLLLLVLLSVLWARHNVFFLARTFQRRRVPDAEADSFIVIDLDDPNHCFGFRKANEAFNTQVLYLTITGLGLLFTRFVHVSEVQTAAIYDALSSLAGVERLLQGHTLATLFPDIGQVVVSVCWLASLAVVAMPALVKLLPRMPFSGSQLAQHSIVTYLREFLPASRWPYAREPAVEEVNHLAARFAESAFWPTGNNRAAQLFFFSFWVFLVILFPLAPREGRGFVFAGFYVALAFLALAATVGAFQALRWSLAYIDARLVQPPVAMSPAPGTQVPSSARAPGVAPSAEGTRGSPHPRLDTSDVLEPGVPVGPGARLGDFEIVRHLASGGMGAVYLARDTVLGRAVALKVLPRQFGSDSERLKRFEKEARVLARLNHPNIATIYAFGQERSTSFLAMELVDGTTLADRIAAGPLPVDEALEVAIEIAAALKQAHERGIVHRDLKPSNIMLTKSGSKLLDFGLAKGLPSRLADRGTEATASLLTSPGEIPGTLRFMSPEQLQGQDIDQRSDIFSFGTVLFEMVTARRAFPGESTAAVIGEILYESPPDLSSLGYELPAGLGGIVRRCLMKKPASRFQDAGELRAALRALPAGAATPAVPLAGGGRVAVLPFLWPAGSADQQMLAEGIAEELTARLSLADVGPVVTSQLAFVFRGAGIDLEEVRRKLGARLVVQGSVRGAGDRIRTSVRLVDTLSGRQLWASSFDQTLGDPFQLQEQLAEQILAALLAELQKR
jgi:TolB-like protein